VPFRSRAQQRYLFAKHPDIAKRFAAETPTAAYKALPQHVRPSDHVLHALRKKKRHHH
jgi:DNA-binding FadR family transcriptional regulator